MMRFPRTAEQQASKLIDRLPPRSRFIIPYALLSLLTPLLVSPDIFSLFSYSVPEGLLHFAGLSLVAAVIYFALYQAAGRMQTGTVKPRSAFWIASLAILGQAAVIRFGLAVVNVLSENHEVRRFGDSFADQFAIPFAACALVLSLLLGSQMALIAALIVALFTGLMLMNSSGMVIALYALTSSIIAIYRVERYRTRNTITKAILGIGLVNVVMSLAILLIANRALTWHLAFESVFMGLLGALITAGIASVVTPVYESAFGVLTDMKLLELSNADNPLLRQLAIRTPGTHHHSSVVATLAEAAAKAIGANSLLARIGCLYHDVGKMAAPRMYIENQQGLQNPHDRVDPIDSVRIITGHVRRGIKMAQEAGLPPQIIDFIPQHHGTRVLSYFYHKARTQAEARGETVNIDDFRYPGPKPQTKEAAILMLSDGAEASVRSLEEPTPENIRLILDKIINNVIQDGQFDECHITLKEISAIREALVNTLIGIYHQRISYPGFNPPGENKDSGETPNQSSEAKADLNGDTTNLHRTDSGPQESSPQQAHAQRR
ncbi:MAG: HDIG domain-containing protein [Blastocatellia bacterium]